MIEKTNKIYIFGLGLYAYSCIDRLDKHMVISGFIDSDKKKWGTEYAYLQKKQERKTI